MFKDDHYFMKKALNQAKVAYKMGEVPVGAVVVKDGIIISRGYNLREKTNDPTAHAELIAMKRAAKKLDSWRLTGCTLYVTLEPCPMCAGVIINSRIDKVVFGAYDQKAGCCTTLYHLPLDERFNHRANVLGGVLEDECAKILSDFFKEKRK
ncbi:MAG: tRNA adenosine(34) deaminase TadA [Clostridia bacterium]|jgi:tRNA(adenine34) deaminase|nr:tRNA adenosine(34) deaminase TadA [Clostridia bacterium]